MNELSLVNLSKVFVTSLALNLQLINAASGSESQTISAASCARLNNESLIEDIWLSSNPVGQCVVLNPDHKNCEGLVRWKNQNPALSIIALGEHSIELNEQISIQKMTIKFAEDFSEISGREIQYQQEVANMSIFYTTDDFVEGVRTRGWITDIDNFEYFMASPEINCWGRPTFNDNGIFGYLTYLKSDLEEEDALNCAFEKLVRGTGLALAIGEDTSFFRLYPPSFEQGLPTLSDEHASMIEALYSASDEDLKSDVAFRSYIDRACE
ncbi:MAG: hypothetical protein ABJO67_04875 [Pseudoruegeria sp.]